MWETVKDLKNEIAEHNAKIMKFLADKQKLPEGFIEFKAHVRREAKKRELDSSIKTVKQIIVYAEEALAREAE